MKFKTILILVTLLALVGIGFFVYFSQYSPRTPSQPTTQALYIVPSLSKPYTNNTYRFLLSMPEGFAAREVTDTSTDVETVVLEDAQAQGIQIVVSPFDEDISTLTQERIQQELPDMKISEPERVEIGESHTGLAFKSDNPAFDGASREVWFVFRGNLYQISTYERLDPLLKAIFQTWKFF